ncbi:MAG: hypothetical protein LKJ99_04435 [Acidaminococcaceae bacterium]|nr:hypothetical protein [Acidaminococcaceae bacterium]
MRLCKKVLVLIMVVLSLAVTSFAASRSEMNISERNALDVFFSNFSEAFMRPFTYNAVSNSELIKFGVMHVRINRRELLRNYDNTYWAIPAQEVDNAAYKYFGKHIVAQSSHEYPLVGNEYLLIKASGEGVRFMQITSLTDNGDGSYTALLNEYVGESDNMHAVQKEPNVSFLGGWKAVIVKAQDNPERYNLKEYLKL